MTDMLSAYDAMLACPPDVPEDDEPRCDHCGAVLSDPAAEYCSYDCAYSAGLQAMRVTTVRPLRQLAQAIDANVAWTIVWPDAAAEERSRLHRLEIDGILSGDFERAALARSTSAWFDAVPMPRGQANATIACRELAIAGTWVSSHVR
jgi:hypothetical protein